MYIYINIYIEYICIYIYVCIYYLSAYIFIFLVLYLCLLAIIYSFITVSSIMCQGNSLCKIGLQCFTISFLRHDGFAETAIVALENLRVMSKHLLSGSLTMVNPCPY